MPTKTTSPSRSSRAAAATIRSDGVAAPDSGSVTIVHRRRETLRRGEPGEPAAHLPDIGGPIGDAVDPLLEPGLELRRVLRDLAPGDIEVVVPVVEALGE